MELEELEERLEVERRRREKLEQQSGAGGIDEAELDELRDKYEEEIQFLKAQHAKELKAAKAAAERMGQEGGK